MHSPMSLPGAPRFRAAVDAELRRMAMLVPTAPLPKALRDLAATYSMEIADLVGVHAQRLRSWTRFYRSCVVHRSRPRLPPGPRADWPGARRARQEIKEAARAFAAVASGRVEALPRRIVRLIDRFVTDADAACGPLRRAKQARSARVRSRELRASERRTNLARHEAAIPDVVVALHAWADEDRPADARAVAKIADVIARVHGYPTAPRAAIEAARGVLCGGDGRRGYLAGGILRDKLRADDDYARRAASVALRRVGGVFA